MRRVVVATVIALPLAACGSARDLKPAMGHELPPAPYGRAERPTANELLVPTPQAVPVRSEELRRQSEEREDDPFDLPPQYAPPNKP